MENNDELQVPLNIPFREPYQRSIELDYFMCTETQMDPSCRYVYPSVTLDYNSTLASEWKMYTKLIELAEIEASGAEIVSIDTADVEMTDDVIIEESGEMHVPDVLEKSEFIFVEDYWVDDRPLLAVDYLPFFSGCRGFDSHIYFYYLTETVWTEIEDFVNYGKCDLVEPEKTIFIDPWAPQVQVAIADACEVEIQCFYEENFREAAANTRWFEVEGEILFHVTQEAEGPEKLFEASILANDQSEPQVNLGAYTSSVATQESIPVSFGPEEGIEVAKGVIPTEIAIDISYYQTSPTDKRMIQIEGTYSEYVNAKKHDGTYLLTITTSALGWFDLLNFFAFPEIFYIALFLALGMISVAIIAAFWAVNRIFTTLKDPPRFKFTPYLKIMTQGPVQGIFLSMLPFFLAQVGVRQVMTSITFFTQFPINIDDFGREIDSDVVKMATDGRIALAFLTIACYMMSCTSQILVPSVDDSDEDDMDQKNKAMVKPEQWKRSHFIIANILINITNLALMEFSYTDTYGIFFFTVFLLMKVFHLLLEMNAEAFLGDVMLVTPISVGLAMTSGLVTIAADDFTDFTMGYYLELIISSLEFVYLDAFLAKVTKIVPMLRTNLFRRLRRRNNTAKITPDASVQDDSVVEDLMGYLTAYGTSTASTYMSPFFIYFYWDYNDQLQLSFLFGFRKKDLLIYLLFGLVILPFQVVMDIFFFNIQELFHGWKVYEYMKYARYRYLNRTARWKGLERSYDESIDYTLRTVDQLCFSSQFYFVLGLGGAGSFLFVLSLSMMLRAQYNMFEDILFGLVVGTFLTLSVITKKIAMFIADIIGLWKISKAQMDDGMVAEEDLPDDYIGGLDRADTDKGWHGRGELQGRLHHRGPLHGRVPPQVPRAQPAVAAGPPRGACSRRAPPSSFRAAGRRDAHPRVSLERRRGQRRGRPRDAFVGRRCGLVGLGAVGSCSCGATKSLQARARRRASRNAPLGLSDTFGQRTPTARRGAPPAALTPGGRRRCIKGWLAATKAVRAQRENKQAQMLSDTEDEEANRRAWGTPRLSPTAEALLRDWLERARSRVGRMKGSDDSSSDGDFGPVRITPQSSLILRQWLAAVRARRGGRNPLDSSSDSDDADDAKLQHERPRESEPSERASRAVVAPRVKTQDGGRRRFTRRRRQWTRTQTAAT